MLKDSFPSQIPKIVMKEIKSGKRTMKRTFIGIKKEKSETLILISQFLP